MLGCATGSGRTRVGWCYSHCDALPLPLACIEENEDTVTGMARCWRERIKTRIEMLAKTFTFSSDRVTSRAQWEVLVVIQNRLSGEDPLVKKPVLGEGDNLAFFDGGSRGNPGQADPAP